MFLFSVAFCPSEYNYVYPMYILFHMYDNYLFQLCVEESVNQELYLYYIYKDYKYYLYYDVIL